MHAHDSVCQTRELTYVIEHGTHIHLLEILQLKRFLCRGIWASLVAQQ